MENETEMPEVEKVRRLTYALMSPAARLASHFGLSLTDVRLLMDMAYFHEARRRGLTLQDIADAMDISISKAALLSKALKQNFVDAESQAELPRRIEFMLWAEPLSLARMKQVLPFTAKEVNAAIKELEKSGRISKDDHGLYRLQVSTDRRVWDTWIARIDGVNNAMKSVGNAVFARFFRPALPAFARTLGFRALPEDLAELDALYTQIFELVHRLDARAGEAPDEALEMSLSIFWSNDEVEAEGGK
jgi:hypothetical protein